MDGWLLVAGTFGGKLYSIWADPFFNCTLSADD